MTNAVNGKKLENLRNRIDRRRVTNEKDYLKWASKPSYVSQKIFDNDLVTIRKNKVITLKVNMVTIQDYYSLKLIV